MKRVLRFAYELLYHPLAWTYDWVAALVSAGKWREWVLTSLPYLSGPRILELGYGPGHLQAALAKNGLWSVGVDSSRQMSRLAQKNLLKGHVNSNLIVGYAQTLGFQSACFDQVVATFPSDALFDPLTLAEIFRTLKPNGRLVIVAAAWTGGSRPGQRLTRWLAQPERFTQEEWIAPWLKPIHQAGFSVDAQIINQATSKVWVILAVKASDRDLLL